MAQSKVYDAVQNNVRKDVQEIGSVLNEVISDIQDRQDETGLSGVPSGFPTLDTITQGWQPSDLIILAARPSVGKTAFSLNIARNAAVDHHMPVAFFSLEMSAKQLAKRLAVSETGLSGDKIKTARGDQSEWERDISLAYVIPDGTFKGLGFTWKNASFRSGLPAAGSSNNQRDQDENRLIVSYTLPLL